MNIEKKVERAAIRLDVFEPGWHEQVNPSSLNLKSDRWCVLGQLYGDYYEQKARRFRYVMGYRRLWIPLVMCRVPRPFAFCREDRRAEATSYWRNEIWKRRGKKWDLRPRVLRTRRWVTDQPQINVAMVKEYTHDRS